MVMNVNLLVLITLGVRATFYYPVPCTTAPLVTFIILLISFYSFTAENIVRSQ
jgi:hypothetical protein